MNTSSQNNPSLPTTVSHDEVIAEMLREKASMREAFLPGIVNLMLTGDMDTGKSMLHKYVTATVGFEALERALAKPSGSLQTMLESASQPPAGDLFDVIAYLQSLEGGVLEVVKRAA